MPAPDPILTLIERFEFHRQAYILGKYNETQLRREFVDKFFSTLGWDVDNNKGFSEKYKEVLHEEPVRIRGTTQFFDYTFRVGGARKFIVETKKPSVRIKDDADSALQLRRYAWNSKLPLSILTNFEEFAVYDCTIKPEHGDTASKGRIEYFTFKDYPAKWEWLVSVFSPDSILRGSFDKYAESTKGKRGTTGVDDDILAEIEQWRDALAKNIALRNPSLTVEELNSVVQRTIDRILFLRICEDRGIEEYETLHKLLEGEKVYERLSRIFRSADDKYNSGLFHFQQEPDWDESPDTLSLTIAIDDKVLKGIIKRLYFPDSQYEFSLIPPAILGHVYEQFLGKVIRLTESHQAKVEYKPEVKKAGGVFYTPQYIVEYIVKHTVGELVKDKTPREVSKICVLDPACGSGSFLIGAYQYLLDWHRDWYIAHLVPVFKEKNSVTDPAVQALLPEQPPKKKKSAASIDLPIYNPGNGKDVRLSEKVRSDWKLTTAEKKRILLNNIFGVDIDQQAVEVTKLSLLLKVLEEENQETVSKQLTITAERALPSLDHNIKCGNSLIGWDILTPEMPADEVKRINPFDWSKEFEPVMAAGGFDAVIGNPPYGADCTNIEKKYLQVKFVTKKGKPESYIFFFEKGLSLLKKNGILGFITPNAWLSNYYGVQLRQYVLESTSIRNVVDLERMKVFGNAVVDTAITIFENQIPSNNLLSVISIGSKDYRIIDKFEISQKTWQLDPEKIINLQSNLHDFLIITKLVSSSRSLSDLAEFSQGVIPYESKTEKESNSYIDSEKKGENWLPLFESASQVRRYAIDRPKSFIHYGPWLGRSREQRFFSQPKILFHRLRKKLPRQLIGTLDESGAINRHALSNLILRENIEPRMLFAILGLFNSNIVNWWFVKKYGLLIEVGGFKVAGIPLPIKWDSDYNRMITLVTQMLDLNKRLQDARLEQERTMLSRQIEATDASIDKLVYELYGLTEEEIKIVEG